MPFLHLFETAGFLVGLLLGSFLNVCISRIPRGESIVSPGSHCPSCKHPIRWYDNLPLLSWLLLRGRCRDCKSNIPWRYPAVESAAGLWIPFVILRCFFTSQAVNNAQLTPSYWITLCIVGTALAILGLLLIALIVIDWQTQRLPDALTFTGIAIALFLLCLQSIFLLPGEGQIIFAFKHLRLASPGSFAARGNVFLTGTESLIFGRIASIVGVALILLGIRWAYKALRHREGLGLGDVKLLAMIAAFLGFWPAVLTLFLGTLLATVYGLILLLRRRAHTLTRLPFGSFLGAAGLLCALFGREIIDWYRSFFPS